MFSKKRIVHLNRLQRCKPAEIVDNKRKDRGKQLKNQQLKSLGMFHEMHV